MIFGAAQHPVDENGQVLERTGSVNQTKLVMSHLEKALASFGAGFDDVVKINRWYAPQDSTEDPGSAVLECASNFTMPGPAMTDIPVPRHAHSSTKVKIAAIAMLGENGDHMPQRYSQPRNHWDWPVPLPYRHGVKCHNMIFLSGQVSMNGDGSVAHPGELSAQTFQTMAHVRTILNELDADFDDTCKVLTHYQGDCGADALHDNLPIRSSHFTEPGPATTGVPLPMLGREGLAVTVEVYAMVAPDATA